MDPFSLGFYAIVCGMLGAIAPSLGSSIARLGLGAIVGMIAATILPLLRGMTGY